MEWILILYFTTTSTQGGMTLTTARFADKQACEYAAYEAEKLRGFFSIQKHVCVPSSSVR
jgi:hypothetical protein